jgi:hypothetical protein
MPKIKLTVPNAWARVMRSISAILDIWTALS